jgi:hypothetical protein
MAFLLAYPTVNTPADDRLLLSFKEIVAILW